MDQHSSLFWLTFIDVEKKFDNIKKHDKKFMNKICKNLKIRPT